MVQKPQIGFKKSLHHCHDKVFKQALSDVRVPRAMIERYLPSTLVLQLKLETIEICNASFIDKESEQTQSDILYRVKHKVKGYVYLLFEHQSSYDKHIVRRFINYMGRIMDQHVAQGCDRLPLVVPILVYNGLQRPYPGSAIFSDSFENSDEVMWFLFDSFFLIDLTSITDDELLKDLWTACPNMLLKHIRKENFLPVLNQLGPVMVALKNKGGEKFAENMLECMISFASMPDDEALREAIQRISIEGAIDMQTVRERWEEQAWLRGRAEERAEARAEIAKVMKESARAMLVLGCDVEQIAKITKLPAKTIHSLRECAVNEH